MAYKIITKLIAERLKSCLPVIISEDQGHFVVGGQILDGVVVASEVIHSMVTSKEKSIFIKLDMAKAYDRVKWSFVQKVLLAFGFSANCWSLGLPALSHLQFVDETSLMRLDRIREVEAFRKVFDIYLAASG
ncbi:uncharacterized protein LOC131857810 [Cryptomeria japonica]|uniref:uncharacterized protein LOC131857810 n=1 Tax=Cryptomeria japonica TaxID=3369 RepID=UPI0027DA59BB|nr:uncharacterized protein LOC131857810 [Cryptomeria japonica]